MSIRDGTEEIQIEAFVESKTKMLHSLEAKTEQKGQQKLVAEIIVEIIVLAANEPVAQGKFVVRDTLTEDGRIGKVTDSQGIVTIKPIMHQRWTPVRNRLMLKPGDWIRTDVRGANAVALRLLKHVNVTVGPDSLVELAGANQIRLLQGVVQISAPKKTSIELLGPKDQKITAKGSQIYRLANEKLLLVQKKPLWLEGFEGSTTNESLGSLIAKVDGRNMPLTVGYHKVSVDIRDQIARTTIEESFVNHTNSRLEGVFYFPLPQDASISGFGMWIGDKLVEADVVEKQRAREIYETILRERRDPGLLEWTGGNLFKARVFPIFAHSEKRIKITYTQVLPLKANRYRYHYGLQSEMLQKHPLRELAIDVKINSVMPLKNVTSPTHTTRINRTEHSAQVEFSAQEYTPTRDFEVVIELDSRQQDVVVIPHRRGEDGYFMMLLTPPGAEGKWQRDILPDGDPLELLVLVDTSASLDFRKRKIQAIFLASLLSSLSPKDKFNVAGCDVESDWVFTKPKSANAKNIDAARQMIEDRAPLGWTDLDNALASAMKQ
ncbi:MAG: hypothetical protein IH991_24315, partial [Planctomycetes bacterium]|nr:hypothetical protein [Planctomycetota bacterium]